MNINSPNINWVLAVVIVISLFNGLDHAVMSVPGLPLNMNLTPAQ